MTVVEALDAAAALISESPAIDVWQEWQPQSDAEILLSEALGKPVRPSMLNKHITSEQMSRFDSLVERRVAGEPVALVVGHIVFDGLDMTTRHGVFVPRLSSELTAREAARRLRARPGKIGVDVATGSGPLALAMASRVPEAEVYGLDISAEAVELGKDNAKKLGLRNVKFVRSDLFAALPKRLHGNIGIITVHPPYVAKHELEDLPQEIKKYEPVHTLSDTSDDGLGLVRLMASEIAGWLQPGGYWMVEVGPHLLRKTMTLVRKAGLTDVAWKSDEYGVTRLIWGRRPR